MGVSTGSTGGGPAVEPVETPRTLEDVPLDQIYAAVNIPQPVVGAVAVGIPILIIAIFFIFWDRPSR